jgi:hypothetical protein
MASPHINFPSRVAAEGPIDARECPFMLGEHMLGERSEKTVIKRPRCVTCARPMRLIRKTLRFAGLPDLYTFECETCGETHIEEAPTPERRDE